MAGIFISYRRDDAQGEARHLFDNLKQHFGENRVFMDVIAIRPGEDYRKVIDSAVASCDVLITLIGREWLQSTTAAGQPRLNDARDFVRLETAAALKRDVRVIPVLVQGAPMPSEDALPDELKPLAFRNAIELSHSRWDYDVRVLTEALERVLAPTAAGPVGASPSPVDQNTPSTTPLPPRERRPIARMAVIGAVVAAVLGGGGYWFWHRPATAPLTPVAGPEESAPSPEPPKTTAPSKLVAGPEESTPPSVPPKTTPPKTTLPKSVGPAATKSSISVPALVGLKEADAGAALERAGLIPVKRAAVKRGDAEPGTVVAQAPGPGESVEKGRSVAIDVAVADLRSVPDLIGKSSRDASAALQQEDLKVALRREATDDAKANAVIRQQPGSGTQVKPGTTVEVTIAVPATVEVPNLTGMARGDALSTLDRMSLKYRVEERPTASERPDVVVGQSPPAGTRAKPGGVIDVQVAVADARTVLDLVGKSIREAAELLKKADLQATFVREASDQSPPGIVLRQEPAAGARVSPGASVTLTYAVAASVEVPKLTGLTRSEAADRLKRLGLDFRWQTISSRQYQPGVVVAQNPEAGARVKPRSAIGLTVAVTSDTPVAGTCRTGYVWREAFPGDRVCVTPETRAQAASDNKQASLRLERNPSKRPYGPDTCAQGYVWREASPSDHVCVPPETRTRTAEDNRQAASRIAR